MAAVTCLDTVRPAFVTVNSTNPEAPGRSAPTGLIRAASWMGAAGFGRGAGRGRLGCGGRGVGRGDGRGGGGAGGVYRAMAGRGNGARVTGGAAGGGGVAG